MSVAEFMEFGSYTLIVMAAFILLACIMIHVGITVLCNIQRRLSVPDDIKQETAMERNAKSLCSELNLDYIEQLKRYDNNVEALHNYLNLLKTGV